MTGLMKKLLGCSRTKAASDVSKGHVRVYVGKGKQHRFELEANYLNHPLFEDLLSLSVDEFGYSYNGALRIACDTDLFLHLLRLLESGNPSVHYMELKDLMTGFRGRDLGSHK